MITGQMSAPQSFRTSLDLKSLLVREIEQSSGLHLLVHPLSTIYKVAIVYGSNMSKLEARNTEPGQSSLRGCNDRTGPFGGK